MNARILLASLAALGLAASPVIAHAASKPASSTTTTTKTTKKTTTKAADSKSGKPAPTAAAK